MFHSFAETNWNANHFIRPDAIQGRANGSMHADLLLNKHQIVAGKLPSSESCSFVMLNVCDLIRWHETFFCSCIWSFRLFEIPVPVITHSYNNNKQQQWRYIHITHTHTLTVLWLQRVRNNSLRAVGGFCLYFVASVNKRSTKEILIMTRFVWNVSSSIFLFLFLIYTDLLHSIYIFP